jgi:hypothetical protein
VKGHTSLQHKDGTTPTPKMAPSPVPGTTGRDCWQSKMAAEFRLPFRWEYPLCETTRFIFPIIRRPLEVVEKRRAGKGWRLTCFFSRGSRWLSQYFLFYFQSYLHKTKISCLSQKKQRIANPELGETRSRRALVCPADFSPRKVVSV